MNERLYRFWRIGFGSTENLTVHGRSLIWRRWRWRIWIGDVSPYTRSSTRRCITWRLGQFLADLALADEGVIAACEAMKALNRAAKYMGDERHEVYTIKQRFVGELIEMWPCTVTRHEQVIKCNGCYGTGTWTSDTGRYSDLCYRCGGTGVYRRHQLLLFRFDIGGRVYSWHQPADRWPNMPATGEVEPYLDDRGRTGACELIQPGLRYETLIETVARWIDQQGLPMGLRARPHGWEFRGCVAADVQRARRRILDGIDRWRTSRRARAEHPTLPCFPTRGAASAFDLADFSDLPF